AWQSSGAFDVLLAAVGGTDTFLKVYKDKDAKFAAGPEVAKVFKAADDARKMAKNTNVQDWNQATNLVITGKAAGQIMGDWAQGEFQVAGKTAGKDYTCLPGLGLNEVIATGGDAFYFPLLKDADKS
ncbi:extracellular solute-binding protein, partial [Mesorhizobium sp. M7A.F.Ca.CA.004.12.1.1]